MPYAFALYQFDLLLLDGSLIEALHLNISLHGLSSTVIFPRL
jgi:hypothetical protein